MEYNDENRSPGNLGTIVGHCKDSGFDFWVMWDITKEQYDYCWRTNSKCELEVALESIISLSIILPNFMSLVYFNKC